MEWVKANKRLPGNRKFLPIKIDGKYDVSTFKHGVFTFDFSKDIYGSGQYDRIEWLDESPDSGEYWNKRCEAAEKVISQDEIHMNGYDGHPHHSDEYQDLKSKWQQLKSTPIPIQTPCVELEKEVERLKGCLKEIKTAATFGQSMDDDPRNNILSAIAESAKINLNL